MGVLAKMTEWRWTPFFAITGGSLLYVIVAEVAVAAVMPTVGETESPAEPVNVIGDEPVDGAELPDPATRTVPGAPAAAMLKGTTPVVPPPVVPPPAPIATQPPEPLPPHLDPAAGPPADAPANPEPPPVPVTPPAPQEEEVEEEEGEEESAAPPPQPPHVVASPGVLRSITRRAQEIGAQPVPPHQDVADDEAE